ncbi:MULTISPECIES: hypothetical protein [unclassified Novosphingobium]|uniref:hypothetical protein n=1 Tax=unclassified Novosphingobium TaxID=2644732 RepID=UPI001359312A|nr:MULTISPECIES: hypothetical protein [unclassified Novosphingobium]
MKFKNVLLSLTASAMLVAPVAAQAGTAASASVGKIANVSGLGQRASTGVKAKQKAEGGTLLLAGLGAAAVVGAVVIIADNGDNKSNGS